jgi:hypothetical protein
VVGSGVDGVGGQVGMVGAGVGGQVGMAGEAVDGVVVIGGVHGEVAMTSSLHPY